MRTSYHYRPDRRVESLEDRKLLAVTIGWNAPLFTELTLTSDHIGDNIKVYDSQDANDFVKIDVDGKNVYDGAADNRLAKNITKLEILGEGGNDTINVSQVDSDWTNLTDNYSYGGADNDTMLGGSIKVRMEGGSGNDSLTGGSSNDTLDGQANDDSIRGQAGNDDLRGGHGNDTIVGGDGTDTIEGHSGSDSLAGDNASTLVSGAYDDKIYGDYTTSDPSDAPDTIDGEYGDDTIYGGGGDDLLYGGYKADSYDGGDDLIHGQDGKDKIWGDFGLYKFAIYVTSGNDTLDGGKDNDTLYGGELRDDLYGGPGKDEIEGGYGGDAIWGGDGSDLISGGWGGDTIIGDLDGEKGCDTLGGDDDNDSIDGGWGDDLIGGGLGQAPGMLDGGSGRDTINGVADGEEIPEENCDAGGGFGPQMLQPGPLLLSTELVGFRDQQFALSFLGLLDDDDLWSILHYYDMSDSEIESVKRWRRLFIDGRFDELVSLLVKQEDCGCGDWSM